MRLCRDVAARSMAAAPPADIPKGLSPFRQTGGDGNICGAIERSASDEEQKRRIFDRIQVVRLAGLEGDEHPG